MLAVTSGVVLPAGDELPQLLVVAVAFLAKVVPVAADDRQFGVDGGVGVGQHLGQQGLVLGQAPHLVDHHPLDLAGGQRAGGANVVAVLDRVGAAVVAVEVPLALAAERVRHGRAAALAPQQAPQQRPVLVADLDAAGPAVLLELLLDLVEQLLVDDRPRARRRGVRPCSASCRCRSGWSAAGAGSTCRTAGRRAPGPSW